jgi:hypothetical protein
MSGPSISPISPKFGLIKPKEEFKNPSDENEDSL